MLSSKDEAKLSQNAQPYKSDKIEPEERERDSFSYRSLFDGLCPLWVKSGHEVNKPENPHFAVNPMSPFSQKRT